MRILAIRGCNLASLAGEFAVELDRAPLSDAGLFAITGPTGAGKSTLLDALCVALFDRTPRLEGRSSVVIGRAEEDDGHKLSALDVRALLRHGTGSGWAEVEFAGRDGGRYVARWSVRRARNRADGRFQAQQMELRDVETGASLGGTKNETLAAIEAKLGFNFDQFRRSALLAQGEFAAFLQANGRQRAELLERMTGTEIYGALSEAAYRRAQIERIGLEELERRGEAQPVLDDEARAALERDRAAADAALANARARLADIDRAVAWHGRAAELTAAVTSAEAALASAREAWDAAGPRRGELERARALLGLAAAIDAVERARQAEAAAVTAYERATAARGASEREHDRAATTLVAVARSAAGRAAEERARLEAAVADQGAHHHAARQWLDERAALVHVAADWSKWDSGFERLIQREAEIAGLDRARPALLEAAEAARAAEVERRRALDEARGELERARAISARAEREAADAATGELRSRREQLEAERHDLRGLGAAVERATECAAQLSAALADGAAAAAAIERASAALDELERAAASGQARRDEAEVALDRLRLAVDLSAHRAQLEPGEPCPLCGAEEHPWADRASPVDAALAEQKARVDQLRAELAAIDTRRAELEASRKARVADRSRAGERASRARLAMAEQAAAWRSGIAAMGELPLIADPWSEPARDWLDARIVAIDARLGVLRERLAGASKLDARASEARSAVAAWRNNADQADHAHREAGERARATAAALAEHDARRERALASRDRRRAELAAGLGALAGDLSGAAERHRAVAAEVTAVREQQRALEQASAELARLRAALEGAGERAAARARELEAALRLAELHGDDAADDSSTLGFEVARAALEAASRARAAAVAAQRAAAERRAASAIDRARVQAQLAEACVAHGVVETELAAIAGRDRAWVEAEAEALDALRRAVEEAGAVLGERRTQLERHTASDAPALGLAEATAARVEMAATSERAQERVTELAGRQKLDDHAREQRAALARELASKRADLDLWQTLSELIGSADGKKFRQFAQSLTLDILLAYANDHLIELASRFRLSRVPGYDLDLQVIDRDMGDEIRSVNSLSGGESFLVSLALALGLSSLSARDARVESLLIDEGFGTLDPATLESALAVLDALQATGRKVGLISHVPGLADRIGVRVNVRPRGGGTSVIDVAA